MMHCSLTLCLLFQSVIIVLVSKQGQAFTVETPSSVHERIIVAPLFQSSEEDDGGSTSPHLRAIEEAMEATRKYGATSKEARVAWEIAEEIEDSIFSPCSKRCDPLPRSASKCDDDDMKPLFVDNSTVEDEEID